VLWIGTELTAPLLTLQRTCEAAAVACGLTPEAKPFRSHVTIGRWRERVKRPALPPADLGTARLDSLVLYESDSAPKGRRTGRS